MIARIPAAVTFFGFISASTFAMSPVFDSQGKFVGDYFEITPGNTPGVLRKIDGLTINIPIIENDFARLLSVSPPYVYASSDCSGQPFLRAGLPLNGVVDNNNILYFPAAPFVHLTTVASIVPPSPLCGTSQGGTLAGQVKEFDLTSLGLVPPFRLPLRRQVFDSRGKLVGYLAATDQITVEILGALITLQANQHGFMVFNDVLQLQFFYESSDCSGKPFISPPMLGGGHTLGRTDVNHHVHFANPPYLLLRALSVRRVKIDATGTSASQCEVNQDRSLPLGEARSFDLRSLGKR
jgi:hypothetical protein